MYKGSGRDPVKTDSYHGVTLSSVLAKMLEMLVLGRMGDLLWEAGIPHINQTAYQRRVSCAGAIFATQEAIARYVRGSSGVHMCLYDLEKPFVSIEYPVLFNRLFEMGVNRKTWRVLKSWYEGAVGQVRLDGALSVKRGVKQGSVLSPTLFILIMNPLLQQLEASGLGLTINSFYAGGFAHADDIRTLATTVETLEVQVGLVRQFYAANFLQVNVKKCEVIVFDRHRGRADMRDDLEVEVIVIQSCSEARCLGFWWRRGLFATRGVEEGISKARRAFFQFGSVGTSNVF